MTQVQKKNNASLFKGRPCHLIHIASHGSDTLQQASDFYMEDFCIEIFICLIKALNTRAFLSFVLFVTTMKS